MLLTGFLAYRHIMAVFTPAHLGKWEALYKQLLEGESLPLTQDGVWMLGKKTGVIAVLHDEEPIYIEATKDIGKTLNDYLNGVVICDFRAKVAVTELGASPRTALERARKGPLAERINKLLPKFRYTVIPATDAQSEKLAAAFTIVADPRLNGPTARANEIIDALPR